MVTWVLTGKAESDGEAGSIGLSHVTPAEEGPTSPHSWTSK